MSSIFTFSPAVALLEKILNPEDRVVIKGATGWVGRTAAYMLSQLNVPLYLTASYSRSEIFGDKLFEINDWNISKLIDFNPTWVIDAAYLTREYTEKIPTGEYFNSNKNLTDQTLELLKLLPNSKLLTFSSGVTEVSEEQGKPYTMTKQNDEMIFKEFANSNTNQITIIRIWSVTGGLVTKLKGFAFSEFILSAQDGLVEVKAKNRVNRRFTLVDEIISVGLSPSISNFRIIDTGGELIEIHELAKKIVEIINPASKLISADICEDLFPDNYFSKNKTWEKICSDLNYAPASLNEQILFVARALTERSKNR